jgi:hypothetical protein
MTTTPRYDPKGPDSPCAAARPPLPSVPPDLLATATAARSICEERVRRVVALLVPEGVYVRAITSGRM